MGNLNLVRLVRLVAHLHTGIRHDTKFRNVWQTLYRECASAVNVFRTKRYDSIEDEEKQNTIHLAEECLSLLEGLDTGNLPVDEYPDGSSLIPDEILEELMLFAPGDTAVRSERVKRLQLNGRELPLPIPPPRFYDYTLLPPKSLAPKSAMVRIFSTPVRSRAGSYTTHDYELSQRSTGS